MVAASKRGETGEAGGLASPEFLGSAQAGGSWPTGQKVGRSYFDSTTMASASVITTIMESPPGFR